MAKINFYTDYPDTSIPDNADVINETIMAVLQILGLDVDTFNPSTNYVVDDFVVYQNMLWRCVEATTGAWNEEKWVKDSMTEVINGVQQINPKLIKEKEWQIETVNIAPNSELVIPELIGKTELWVYYGGNWYQRQMMYADAALSKDGVVFNTSDADASKTQKFGVSVSFSTGAIRNDNQSTANITKIKYR